jgi:hypothetical protein
MDLQVERKNIIYLYRNPVDTIYSQLRYYQESPKDKLRILHWTERYACHVAKWLIEEEFITHKTVIRYESLKSDIFNEFRKVIEHFGGDYDHRRLEACVAQVTKEEVKRKSTYISQVMTIGREYQDQREKFRTEQSEFVWNIIRGVSAVLYDDKNVLVNLFPSAAQDYEGIQHSIHNEQRTC